MPVLVPLCPSVLCHLIPTDSFTATQSWDSNPCSLLLECSNLIIFLIQCWRANRQPWLGRAARERQAQLAAGNSCAGIVLGGLILLLAGLTSRAAALSHWWAKSPYSFAERRGHLINRWRRDTKQNRNGENNRICGWKKLHPWGCVIMHESPHSPRLQFSHL